MINLIDSYTTVITDEIDTPTLFIKASAYHLVSATLGRYFCCPALPKLAERPNVWLAVSSIPGRCRRSHLYYADTTVLTSVLKTHYKHKGIDSDKVEEHIDELRIEEGTAPGIADHITNAKHDGSFDIHGSEFGTIFKEMKNPTGTKVGVSSLLSKLYSGEGGAVYLSQRKGQFVRRIPYGLYTTMFIGLQEPWEYISPIMVRQGLMRRIVLIYIEKNQRYKDLLTLNPRTLTTDLQPIIDGLSEMMKKYDDIFTKSGGKKIVCTVHPDVWDKINALDKEVNDAVDNTPSNLNIVKQTFAEHLTKFSMIEAIIDNKIIPINGEPTLMVTPEHYKRAHDFFSLATSNYNSWVPKLGFKRQEITTHEEPLEYVYGIILRAGKKGIARTKLYKTTHMRMDELEPLLSTLMQRDDIQWFNDISTGGRKPTIYIAKILFTPKKFPTGQQV